MRLRRLRLRLLATYRHRGKILQDAKENGTLSDVIWRNDVSHDEAYVCIALHQNWEAFLEAERWNHSLGQPCPTTPMDALVLLDSWVVARWPHPVVHGLHPINLIAAIASVISQASFADILALADLAC